MIVKPLHPRGDNRATAIIFAELGCNERLAAASEAGMPSKQPFDSKQPLKL